MSTTEYNQGNELIIAEPDGTLKYWSLFMPLSLGLPVILPKIIIRQIGQRDQNQSPPPHDAQIVPAQ